MRKSTVACVALALPFGSAFAGQPSFGLGTVYQCPNGVSFKVTSCAGSADTDWCNVEMTNRGQPMSGRSTRSQVMALLPSCSAQGQVASGTGQAAPAPGAHRPGGAFQVNDKVKVNIRGQGWMDGTIVSIANGIENEYKVQVPGKGVALAAEADLRLVSVPPPASVATAGQPPKPGLVSCAGKFEGRYASAAGSPGMVTVVFRSGKADVTTPDMVGNTNGVTAMSSTQQAECWTGGGKIYLKWLNGPNFDFTMDINDDGTLDSPYGELKKKGS